MMGGERGVEEIKNRFHTKELIFWEESGIQEMKKLVW